MLRCRPPRADVAVDWQRLPPSETKRNEATRRDSSRAELSRAEDSHDEHNTNQTRCFGNESARWSHRQQSSPKQTKQWQSRMRKRSRSSSRMRRQLGCEATRRSRLLLSLSLPAFLCGSSSSSSRQQLAGSALSVIRSLDFLN